MTTIATRRAASGRTGIDRSAGRKRPSTIIVTAILVVVALYFLVPVYWVIVASTKTSPDLFSTNGFLFSGHFALWDNLSKVLTYNNGVFLQWLLNSVLYAGVGALLATYLAAAGGYALAKPVQGQQRGVRHRAGRRPGPRHSQQPCRCSCSSAS